jgi:lysozyme family protein
MMPIGWLPMANFNRSIIDLLRREGGDKVTCINGSKTKFGISQHVYPNMNIEELTLVQACAFYKVGYWDKIRGDEIGVQRIANVILDTAVSMSPCKAITFAQKVMGMDVSGTMVPRTLSALNNRFGEVAVESFVNDYSDLRLEYYRGDSTFLQGWINRVEEVRREIFDK